MENIKSAMETLKTWCADNAVAIRHSDNNSATIKLTDEVSDTWCDVYVDYSADYSSKFEDAEGLKMCRKLKIGANWPACGTQPLPVIAAFSRLLGQVRLIVTQLESVLPATVETVLATTEELRAEATRKLHLAAIYLATENVKHLRIGGTRHIPTTLADTETIFVIGEREYTVVVASGVLTVSRTL